MSRLNFVLSWFEYEKKFYNLGACATGHLSLHKDHSVELHAQKDGHLGSSVISELSEIISNNAPSGTLIVSVWIRHHIDVSKVKSKFSKARVIFPSFLFLRQKLWEKNKRKVNENRHARINISDYYNRYSKCNLFKHNKNEWLSNTYIDVA